MEFKKVQNLPKLRKGAIEDAVEAFVRDSHTEETHADPKGLFDQTIEVIAHATLFQHDDSRQFWMATDGGEVMAYAIVHISKDVDNQLCFWITQAWVHPICRGSKEVKGWFQLLRDEAKRLLCKHIVIPSSRGVEAYCRFLGKGWKPYVTLLKEDL